MNLPNRLSVLRIAMAPVFFILYWLPGWTSIDHPALFTALVVVFFAMEATDIIDGYIARRMNLVTDLGKLLDPFSDMICRLTYFTSFVASGIMHQVFCLIILYREFSVVFIRMILARRGTALAARFGGKLKSFLYFIASSAALVYSGAIRFSLFPEQLQLLRNTVDILFGASVIIAVVSFFDYLRLFLKDRSVGSPEDQKPEDR